MANDMEKVREDWFLSSRLRSARMKKRLKKEDFDKYLLMVERQERELSRHEIYYEYLPQPVQRGYVRTFQLTDEALGSPDAETYRKILAQINTRQYSPYPVFNDKLGKKKSRRLKRAFSCQLLRDIYPWDYAKMPKIEQMMFEPIFSYNSRERYVEKYRFKYSWLFKLVVMPYMVDKVERIYGDVKSQCSFYKKITRNHFNRLSKIHGYSWRKWGDSYSYKNDIVKSKCEIFKNVPVWKRAEQTECC